MDAILESREVGSRQTRLAVALLLAAMKIVLWNPMSCSGIYRLEEIDDELQNMDVVVMPGSQMRQPQVGLKPPEVTKQRLANFDAYHWGYARGPFTNKACGLTILVNRKRCRGYHVATVHSPNKALQGRGGALRLRWRGVDITVLGAYFPVRPKARRYNSVYVKAVNALGNWIEKVLDECKTRSTPVTAFDLNDDVIRALPQQFQHAVGAYQGRREGEPGRKIRGIFDSHSMTLANTHFDIGDTWFAENTSTRIDFFGIPESMMKGSEDDGELIYPAQHAEVRIVPLERSRRKLQLIASSRPRDHIPILLVFRYSLSVAIPREKVATWDQGQMAMGLRSGYKRGTAATM